MSLAERTKIEPIAIKNIKDQLEDYREKVERAVQLAEEIFVIDNHSAEEAMNFAAEAKKMKKSIEEKKLDITGPARKFVSEINAIAKSYTARLEEVYDIILHKINLWKEDVKSSSVNESLYCEELDTEFEINTCQDLTKIRASECTAYERTVWKYEVMDYRQVPIDMLEVCDSSVKLAIRNGERNIPGLRIYKETKTSLRSR